MSSLYFTILRCQFHRYDASLRLFSCWSELKGKGAPCLGRGQGSPPCSQPATTSVTFDQICTRACILTQTWSPVCETRAASDCSTGSSQILSLLSCTPICRLQLKKHPCEDTLNQNYDPPTQWLAWVTCRATRVGEKSTWKGGGSQERGDPAWPGRPAWEADLLLLEPPEHCNHQTLHLSKLILSTKSVWSLEYANRVYKSCDKDKPRETIFAILWCFVLDYKW